MFSILRFILIVGAIFYYSPVRQHGDMPASIAALWAPAKTEAAVPAPESADRLDMMWQALPESAKQAVLDKILTTSGLGAAPKAADTLQPGDRHPAFRPNGDKPRI